eukprot:m.322539 g.322539  ORF g.322539 m.322539 type:complete len:387 (+) comp27100_c0_seq1:817-1977(+)
MLIGLQFAQDGRQSLGNDVANLALHATHMQQRQASLNILRVGHTILLQGRFVGSQVSLGHCAGGDHTTADRSIAALHRSPRAVLDGVLRVCAATITADLRPRGRRRTACGKAVLNSIRDATNLSIPHTRATQCVHGSAHLACAHRLRKRNTRHILVEVSKRLCTHFGEIPSHWLQKSLRNCQQRLAHFLGALTQALCGIKHSRGEPIHLSGSQPQLIQLQRAGQTQKLARLGGLQCKEGLGVEFSQSHLGNLNGHVSFIIVVIEQCLVLNHQFTDGCGLFSRNLPSSCSSQNSLPSVFQSAEELASRKKLCTRVGWDPVGFGIGVLTDESLVGAGGLPQRTCTLILPPLLQDLFIGPTDLCTPQNELLLVSTLTLLRLCGHFSCGC